MRENAGPALSSENTDAGTALSSCVFLDAFDQREPLAHVLAAAGSDRADRAIFTNGQMRGGRRFDSFPIIGEPKKLIAFYDALFLLIPR